LASSVDKRAKPRPVREAPQLAGFHGALADLRRRSSSARRLLLDLGTPTRKAQMSNITTIDLGTLATVFGGADEKGEGELTVDPAKRNVSLRAKIARMQSERNQCITNNIKKLCPTTGTFSSEVADPDACVDRMNRLCGAPGNGTN
jgi:hypothetical protein